MDSKLYGNQNCNITLREILQIIIYILSKNNNLLKAKFEENNLQFFYLYPFSVPIYFWGAILIYDFCHDKERAI